MIFRERLRAIHINKSKCEAWVQGGARAEDLDKDVGAYTCTYS